MTLLDTHVLLWLRTGDARLGSLALRKIDRAWHVGEVTVSAITFWEVALLRQKRRIAFEGTCFCGVESSWSRGSSKCPLTVK